MKRLLMVLLIAAGMLFLSPVAQAKGADAFDNSIEEIKDSVDPDTFSRMERLGLSDADVATVADLSLTDSLDLIGEMLADYASAPAASCALLIAVVLLSSLLESYTFSLRYADTKDVMGAVSSLLVITTLVTPILRLIQTAADTIKGASSLMLLYVPVMIGIMAFGGHIISSGGYYATVMAASQGISQLSSSFFAPLMNIFLALSVSSAVSDRIKLSGICEITAKVLKWTLTLAMTLFTAILSIQGVAANAADSVASKTVRFALSSFIPIVGGSVSEAYKSIEGSVNLLRSGIGVFVIIAVILTFLPLIIQILLWQLSALAAKTVSETFGVTSVVTILSSVSSVLSVLLALIAAVTAVFLISSGVLISVGGSS